MRLEHLLMKHLVLSRREMKKLIKNEAVLIDGVPATHVSNNVDATLQVITVNGAQIHDDSQKYYMLNKPQGVISATTDKEHQMAQYMCGPCGWIYDEDVGDPEHGLPAGTKL